MKYLITENQYKLIFEKKDYFTGSKFGDEDGNEFSVETVYDFVKKNKKKYFKEKFPLKKIEHNLKWWNKIYDIKNSKHKERMMNADTSFPLLVVIEKNGNYSVADGLNRLYKAIKIEKRKTLPVYVVNKNDIEPISQNKKNVSKKLGKGEEEMSEYSRTLKNARKQGVGLRFPKTAIKYSPERFRPYNR